MNRKEQIIQYGKAQGKSQEEIDKAVAKYESTIKPKEGVGKDISEAFQGSVDYIKEGYEQAKQAKTPIGKTEAGLKQGAGIIGAALSPLAPVTKYIGKGIQGVADVVSEDEGLQKFAMSDAGKTTARIAEDVQNTATLMGVRGVGKAPAVARTVAQAPVKAATSIGKTSGSVAKQVVGATRDIVPEGGSFINEQVSKSLHLTPADMSNFFGKIDEDIGTFMADRQLIGENVETTLANLRNFKTENYQQVRSLINEVPKSYKISQVPRYYDSLKQITNQVKDVPGLEKVAVEAENLMKRETVTLEDVQRVKELLDDHFSLFKVTGDVKDAASKQGVANMRRDLKEFIENQVKESTGQDIAPLNKNVMASRAILDAAELRTPRGYKSWQFTRDDLIGFGFGSIIGGGFNPITGLAGLFMSKALSTPSVRLRLAKIVDGWSDAKKAKAKAELESGVIPNEFRKAVIIKHNGQRINPD